MNSPKPQELHILIIHRRTETTMRITKEILNSYLKDKHPDLYAKWNNSNRRPISDKKGTLDLFDIVEEDMKDRVMEAVDKNPDRLHVRIDSPGGDVYSCLTMINALKTVKNLTTENMGIAASCAAVLFMLGDDRIAHSASQFLFHRAWTIALGNAPQLRDAADSTEHFDKVFYDTVYSKKMTNAEDKDKFFTMLERDKFLTKDQMEHYGVYNVLKEEKKEENKEIKKVSNSYLTANEHSVLSSVRLMNKKNSGVLSP